MFGRKVSYHGRLMGEVRSAQQKCVRRAMLEPLILLNLEHLLTTPDFSRAALSRLQVIAAEDLGVEALGLLPVLTEFEREWPSLGQFERAQKLIQASFLCVDSAASRFVPHWAVTIMKGVGIHHSVDDWRSLEKLQSLLDRALREKSLQEAAVLIEEIFLRHPIENEVGLPLAIGFDKGVMSVVWDVLSRHCPTKQRRSFEALRRLFGPPSREGIASRLFLYLALLMLIREIPIRPVSVPKVSKKDVESWLERAKRESFEIPDWMQDRHTPLGKKRKLGYEHFFNEACVLANPSSLLGRQYEDEMLEISKAIYLEEEKDHGRRSSTANMRKRWRRRVASCSMQAAS